mmetsp:Transcript_9196/g.11426  ORF Transcript_9196/g.11426 Transcript_9196/m.11426 type:complete len:103 (+) Transcript_9196:2-310(+)
MGGVTCACSIQYMISPIDFLKECHRVLRPQGKVILAFSNRCFGLKATKIWRSSRNDRHVEFLNGFFQYAGGFDSRKAFDITASCSQEKYQDPMIVIEAIKTE